MIGEFLQEAWLRLRDNAGPEATEYALGAIDMAEALGALNSEQSELWKRRIRTCPGHDDEGGRDWCSYCGKMPRTEPQDGPHGNR